MKIEVEAKIQEEGTGVYTSWVWEKEHGHGFSSFAKQ